MDAHLRCLMQKLCKGVYLFLELVEIHTDGRVFVPPLSSPPGAVEDNQLKGGARNDEQPVKHAPHTRRTRRAATGPRSSPPLLSPLLWLFPASRSSSFSVDGFCGEARPAELPGEERPHRLHRRQHAVCVRRLPGECALPAQVCAANATASTEDNSVLIHVPVTAKQPCFCFESMFLFRCTFSDWDQSPMTSVNSLHEGKTAQDFMKC